ncbi:hypothetical protein AWB69_04862 [Caballeronia udeis]|uniref:Uncharacterized protein n=1 Tax=Caballeronia udeis TaxID=1232866 RepID=A0A158HW10_9BURK|nr:hypothetical protein AWB69_04862 [Caballeronia udeis]
MKLGLSGMAPKAAERSWHVASWLAIAAATGLIVEGLVHASAKIVGLRSTSGWNAILWT